MEHQRLRSRTHGRVPRPSEPTSLTETVEAMRAQLNRLAEQVRAVGAGTVVTSYQVRSILKARNCRQAFLNAKLFAEPAWDMLLELYARELEHQRVSVSQLYCASGVPDSTAHRWIDILETEGLMVRRADPLDARRVWVELSPKGSAAMQHYFDALPVRLLPR